MVPGVVGELGGIGRLVIGPLTLVISFLAREYQCAVSSQPQGDVAHLQQLSLARLSSTAHPEFNSVVIVHAGGQFRSIDIHVGLSVEADSLVLIIQIPSLVGHGHVAVASVVTNGGALAFVHLPIANQVPCGRILCLAAVEQCGGHIMSLIPEQQFVECGRCSTAEGNRTLSAVSTHILAVEKYGLIVVVGHSGVQLAVGREAQAEE